MSVVLDILLNPLLIFGWGPVPRLGIAGSAIATLIAQALSFLALVLHLYRIHHFLCIRRRELRLFRRRLVARAPVGHEGHSDGAANVRGVFEHGCADLLGEPVRLRGNGGFQCGDAVVELRADAGAGDRRGRLLHGGAKRRCREAGIGWARWQRRASTFNFLIGGALIAARLSAESRRAGIVFAGERRGDRLAEHLNAIVLWSFAFFGMSMVLFGVVRATGAVMAPLIMLAISLWGVRVPFAYWMLDRWQARCHMVELSARLVDLPLDGGRLLPLRRMAQGAPGLRMRAQHRYRAFEIHGGNRDRRDAAAGRALRRVWRHGAAHRADPRPACALRASRGYPDFRAVERAAAARAARRRRDSAACAAARPPTGWRRISGAWCAACAARTVGPTWFCDGNDAARPMLRRAGIPQEFIVDVKDHPLLPESTPRSNGGGWRAIMPPAHRPAPPDERGARPDRDGLLPVGERGAAGGSRCVAAARDLYEAPLLDLIQVGNKRTMRRGLRRLAVNTSTGRTSAGRR